jgi:O-antigen ligase
MLNADRRPATRGWIVLGLVLLVLTLSRSGMLAAGVALLVRWGPAWTHGPRRTHERDDHGLPVRAVSDAPGMLTRSPRLTLALATTTCVLVAGLLAAPAARADIADRLAPAAERLSAAEGSARLHSELLRRGVDEATVDVPRTLLGVGYGTSYLLLRDVFGTRYGNFHSLYLSAWVEMGIGALLILLVLLVVPLRWATHWRPMVAALLVFNLFYQAGTEPGFWAMLALAWQDGTS